MIIGAVLITGALSLAVYNIYDDKRAGKQSDEVLMQLEEKIIGSENISAVSENLNINSFDDPLVDKTTKAGTVKVGNINYIGILNIPVLGLKLPVIDSWSYDNLAIAPCCYFGSAESGQFVIAAHNYNSHFGRIKNLMSGDEVIFTDTNGKEYSYVVTEKENIPGSDGYKMTANNWDLSLFTCTFDGSERVTVRCDKK